MRIGFRNYWKTDRFLYMPILAFTVTRNRLEFMILGVGVTFWRV